MLLCRNISVAKNLNCQQVTKENAKGKVKSGEGMPGKSNGGHKTQMSHKRQRESN